MSKTDHHKKRRREADDDAAFVQRFRDVWGRPTLSPSEAAAFDDAVLERAARHAPRGIRFSLAVIATATATATVAAAAVIAIAVLPAGQERPAVTWVEALAEAYEYVADDAGALAQGSRNDDGKNATLMWLQSTDPTASLGSLLNAEYQALAFLVTPPDPAVGGLSTDQGNNTSP